MSPIIAHVPRRLHVPRLFTGQVPLDPVQAHHAREVLRLKEGDAVELFDSVGREARGVLRFVGPKDAAAVVERVNEHSLADDLQLTVASAVPKGERADWMVEKLSELGVVAFIPLMTERSVVKPEGKNKLQRWERIATESAKQSRRSGVMQIQHLRPLADMLGEHRPALYLSTAPDAKPLNLAISELGPMQTLAIFIGPEGGWTDAELEAFRAAGIRCAKLTSTILRIETAAIVGAAIALAMRTSDSS